LATGLSLFNHKRHNELKGLRTVKGFTFGIAPKVTKGLGPKPPKAEKPGGIPKIRKLAALRQYGFLYGIPPGFSPTERFFRQRPRGYGGTGVRGYGDTTLETQFLELQDLIPCNYDTVNPLRTLSTLR